jgi:flagellin-specific chaperone FliS
MIDFTTETERKRCKQIDKCQDLMSEVMDALGCGIDTRKATNRLIKLRNYLNREFPDKEKSEMLNALVAIWKWCSQDLAEKAYEKDASRNFEITLKEICAISRPFVEKASKLRRCGGKR